MNYCPQCHLVHDDGSQFCQRCGQPLVGEETVRRTPCPNCGTSIFPGQNFCMECGHSQRTVSRSTDPSKPSSRKPLFYPSQPRPENPSPSHWRPKHWITGLSVLLGLTLLFYFWFGEPSRIISRLFTSSPGQTHSSPPQNDILRRQVERITEKIRAAHLKQDINKFMSCYHSAYPELGRLEGMTLENWKKYDFRDIRYRISNIQMLGPKKASADISWDFQLYNHQTKTYELHRATFQIILEAVGNDWKIRESKELDYS